MPPRIRLVYDTRIVDFTVVFLHFHNRPVKSKIFRVFHFLLPVQKKVEGCLLGTKRKICSSLWFSTRGKKECKQRRERNAHIHLLIHSQFELCHFRRAFSHTFLCPGMAQKECPLKFENTWVSRRSWQWHTTLSNVVGELCFQLCERPLSSGQRARSPCLPDRQHCVAHFQEGKHSPFN